VRYLVYDDEAVVRPITLRASKPFRLMAEERLAKTSFFFLGDNARHLRRQLPAEVLCEAWMFSAIKQDMVVRREERMNTS